MAVGRDGFHVQVMDQELQRALRTAGPRAMRDVGAAMWQQANLVFNASQNSVPVDTGALKGSGTLDVNRSGARMEATIAYGSVAVQYASIVHEAPETTNFTEGGPKFVERPLEAAIPTIRASVQEAARRALGRSV